MNNVITAENYFEPPSVPIFVSDFEHHGSGNCHSHPFLEFVYIERGFSLHSYNNVTTILTPGDLFAIRPGDIHGYTSANHTHLYNCLFYTEALENVWDELMQLPGVRQVFDREEPSVWKRIHLDLPGRSQAVEYLKKMQQERLNKLNGWELNLKSLLTSFLILFSRSYNECYGVKSDGEQRYFKYVYNALSYVESNYREDVSVNDIACAVGLSTDYLSRQFKHFTGMTPVEYIKSFRLAKAVEILKNPLVSVAEAASQAGFDDPCYFARQFRQMMGMSPSEYRGIKG